MGKSVYIAEKPSVAQEFAKALKLNTRRKDGYLEADSAIVTWCVGHLVTMSYPEVYDAKLKRWSLDHRSSQIDIFDTQPLITLTHRLGISTGNDGNMQPAFQDRKSVV